MDNEEKDLQKEIEEFKQKIDQADNLIKMMELFRLMTNGSAEGEDIDKFKKEGQQG